MRFPLVNTFVRFRHSRNIETLHCTYYSRIAILLHHVAVLCWLSHIFLTRHVGPAAQLLRAPSILYITDQIRPGKPPDPLSCGQGAPSIILTRPRASCSGEEQVSHTASWYEVKLFLLTEVNCPLWYEVVSLLSFWQEESCSSSSRLTAKKTTYKTGCAVPHFYNLLNFIYLYYHRART